MEGVHTHGSQIAPASHHVMHQAPWLSHPMRLSLMHSQHASSFFMASLSPPLHDIVPIPSARSLYSLPLTMRRQDQKEPMPGVDSAQAEPILGIGSLSSCAADADPAIHMH